MAHKNSVLRINVFALLTMCLVVTGCQKQNPASSNGDSSQQSSSSSISEPSYNIVRPEFTPDYDNYDYENSEAPFGVNMTYYTDAYSRGFSWLTGIDTEDTELYLVKSDKGADADFNDAQAIFGSSNKLTFGTNGSVTGEGLDSSKKGSSNSKEIKLVSHKVHVENLEKGQAYSYKIGSQSGYYYGAFIVDKEEPKSITAIQLSDAQTKDLTKTNVWRNTFTHAVEKADKDLDMVLFNGDQFDQNNGTSGATSDKDPFRLFRYAKAIDVIQDYKFNLPYMSSSGNHEPASAYSHYLMSDIDYAGYDYKGAYYSYDYGFAHFVVLNTNTVDDEQINWLKNDLDDAYNAKWKIVMMHISPYSTGDHCQSKSSSPHDSIVEKFTPIFSQKHVDLVLQAHDHTYNKTLPYKWDAAGYTKTARDESVVNLEPETETKGEITYDKNPNGTYYVTTGAAGHRNGAAEEDGIWAECVKDGDEIKGLNPSKTFTDISKTKYAIEVGTLTQENEYEPYTHGGYTSDQHYEIGDPASGNVNAAMFGVLNLTQDTLSYYSYTVNDDTVKLFDTLDVLKA